VFNVYTFKGTYDCTPRRRMRMMGKLTLFEICLNNPEAVYCAGQTVYGTLNVNLQAALKLEGKYFIYIFCS